MFNKFHHVIPLKELLKKDSKISKFVAENPYNPERPQELQELAANISAFFYEHLENNPLYAEQHFILTTAFLGRDDIQYLHVCFRSNLLNFYADSPVSFIKEQEIIKLALIREVGVDANILKYQIPVVSLRADQYGLDAPFDDYGSDWYE